MPPLDAHGLDVGAGGLGDAQPVEGQQRDQRMLGGPAEPGGDQQSAELVTVQPDGVRLVIQPRAPYVGGVVLLAPAGVLAQVQLVGLTGLDVAAGPRSASRLGRGTGPGSRRPQRQPDGADGAGGPARAGEPVMLMEPQLVQTRGYRCQFLPFSSACLISGWVVACSCRGRSAVLI